MLSRLFSLRSLLLIVVVFAIVGAATMAFGASDATTPRAIPYMTSNVATGLNQPTAIAIDDNGNIYVGENYTGATAGSVSALVKKIDATTGQVTVFAGGGTKVATGSPCANPDPSVPGHGNTAGDGCPATSAYFGGTNGGIRGLAVYNGYLYIEDLGGYMMHRVNLATNIIEWVGGYVSSAWQGDGTLTATFSLFKPPTGFAVDPLNGNVYFSAGGTNAATIRMITSDSATCASAKNGPFNPPCIITVVNYKGQTSADAPPNPTACEATTAFTPATSAYVWFPQSLAFDGDRNLYIAETKCGTVRKVAKNPATGIVDQNSTFTTFVGNNTTTGTSPSWYDTTAATLGFFGNVRGVASAGGNDLYIATTTAVYFYDSATKWAHIIWGATPTGCTGHTATPFIGCPAPWATHNDGSSGTGAMAVDKAGNLYLADYTAGTVAKAALGTDFIGTAPTVTRSLATTQYVLLHGGLVTGATSDAPFSAVVTTSTDPLPQTGCNSYVATGDNGTDCVIAVTYAPSAQGRENGLLHVQATIGSDIPLQALGNPTVPPQLNLSSDKSACALGSTCDIVVTATVTPGDLPVSTGLAVTGDMSACTGGSATQAFTSGASNTFTYTCSLPATAAADVTLGPVKATDDQLRSSSAKTVLISITDAPVANPQSVNVTYNTPKQIILSATGTGTLTYTVVTQPAHGTLSGDAPALTYTPEANYVGSDTFTFKAASSVDSAPATVTINVLPAAPVASEQSVTVEFNTTTAITLTSTGTGTLTYTIVRPPAHGQLTGTAPNVSYAPDSNYSGPDSFTFKTADINGQESAAATVSITVLSVVPIAEDQSLIVTYNTAKPITLAATGMGTLSYTVLTQPLHGTLSGTAPNLTYTPASNYLGSDSFTFKVSNGSDSAPATVNIMVLPPAPVATPQSVTVNYNGSKSITLAATGSGTLTYTIVAQPAHGTLSGTAPDMTYTAASGYSGTDSFSFKASDSNGQSSAPAVVSITVLSAAPIATPQSVTVNYNEAKSIALAATGAGALTYTVVTEPLHGTLSGTAPALTYTPASNYSGTDSFTFKATDSNTQESAPATVSINVLPAVPVANAQSISVTYNTPKSFSLTATGTGTLTYTVVSQPTHGTLSGTAPALTYTPASNYLGTDSFTFKAADSNGQNSAPATISITVATAPPVANAQSVTVAYNGTKTITLSGTGYGTLTYTVVSQPSHGTLSGTAPNLTYTPTLNYSGADSFTFKATDSNHQDGSPATINITVNGPDLTFVVATGGTTTATVTAGNLAVFNLQVSGWTGATGPVSFTCTGAPAGSTCGVSPTSVTLNGTTPVAVAVMVQTLGSKPAAAGSITPFHPDGGFPWGTALALTTALATLFTLKKGKMQWRLAGSCAALVLVVALSACGGSSQAPTTQTQAGNYTVAVTAKSGDITKTINLTLNVR